MKYLDKVENIIEKHKVLILISTIVITIIGIVGYYIYCQNRPPRYVETEELSSYTEDSMKKDAQKILDKITTQSKKYGDITFEYSKGKHNIEEDTNVITYYILYNGKKTSLSLDFETIDSFDITKITFNDNRAYMTMNNEMSLSEMFVTSQEEYSRIVSCMLLALPDSIDEDAFSYINIINLYEELYEKEHINKCGYDISVKKYRSDLIIYTFEKTELSID